MEKHRIEETAYRLLKEMWADRASLLPGKMTVGPFDLLEPALAARFLGVEFELSDGLGRFGYRSDRFEVAGLINRDENRIAVSRKFPREVQRFTAAHELGHFMLHPETTDAHRDRPISSAAGRRKRPQTERDADFFAACFLMPRKLVTKELQFNFNIDAPLVVNEHVAFYLRLDQRRETRALNAAAAVASASEYAGRFFYPLTQKFGVSTEAMAIRLEELSLVRDQ